MISAIRILVPTEWSNTEKGNYFEELVASLFERMQWSVRTRIRVTGMEIDLLAEHNHSKHKALIECKFLNSSFDAPIISKLIGNAITRSDIDTAWLVCTSEPGKDAEGKLLEIEERDNTIRGGLKFAYTGPEQLTKLFLEVKGLPSFTERTAFLPSKFRQSIGAATLLITPEESCWIIEQNRSGLPEKAFIVPTIIEQNRVDDYATIRRFTENEKLWIDIELVDGFPDLIESTIPNSSQPRREYITQVPMADKFDDYAPSRPEDFVGRSNLLSQIIEHFKNIRQQLPRRRIIALSGPSGFGKSSVVLKLADKCKHSKLNNQIYLYHVDSRSATRPIFVIEAIRMALQSAIDTHFVDSQVKEIRIDSVEDPFATESVKVLLSDLIVQKKIVVIFFDQFEELLVKEQLFNTFDSMKKAAFAVESLQSNVVLGFSWRTSIALGESHPAYYMWHSLQDKRAEFRIGLFEREEALEMLTNLEKNLNYKLETTLRRHILDQSQGIPWLLKKFCVHVYRRLKADVSQKDLLGTQLDAANLFKEETDNLTVLQLDCLRYIAINSPADLMDVHDKFEQETPTFLYENRLIIRSGHKYSVYWDVFKEYLISGKVPPIPMTYVPQVQLTTALTVLKFIIESDYISISDIQETYGYTNKTSLNIISDLSSLFFVDRSNLEQINVSRELSSQLFELPFEIVVSGYAAEQLKRHVVVQKLYETLRPGDEMSYLRIRDVFAEIYPSSRPETLNAYINRLMPWLRFAGLVEVHSPDRVIRPLGEGAEKGKAVIKQARLIDGQALFLCTSGPHIVVYLATKLVSTPLSREAVLSYSLRNAAHDLTALKLAKWRDGYLHPINELNDVKIRTYEDNYEICALVVKNSALKSLFLTSLIKSLEININTTDQLIAANITKEIGREWQSGSIQRYVGAGRRWLEYFGKIKEIIGQMDMFDGIY
jgi:hypothetical protein